MQKFFHARLIILITLFALTFVACSVSAKKEALDKESPITVTIVHFNDIYEITPVSGGQEGGIARVATLKKQLQQSRSHVITTLGGDLFSPSAVGTALVEGERLAGRQMVDVLNGFGLDYATFGNHEFDLQKQEFDQRMQEAKFTWISSNVFDNHGKSFTGVQQRWVVPVTDPLTGNSVRIGFVGLTLDSNNPDYVSFLDPIESARVQVAELKKSSDIIIALTHQSLAMDEQLVSEINDIDLLLGGHEHVNYQRWRGNFVPILKGDANVRSVYVVDLSYAPKTGKITIKPHLVPINDTLVEDPEIKKIVDQWMEVAFSAFREQGFDPEKTVTTTRQPLDGLESQVRTQSTNLTRLIANSMMPVYPEAELSLYNSGSIRIDDILPAGEITQYDVIRILPFGGEVQLADIKGSLLKRIMNTGEQGRGAGTYLQCAHCEKSKNGQWLINAQPLNENKSYKTSIASYLGKKYLNEPGFTLIENGENTDIRKLVIQELKNNDALY